MNKQEFLEQLRGSLSGFPQEDVDERLSFYSEMIDDRVEEGLSEEEAVSGIGTVDEVTSQIIGDIPLSKIVKEKVKPRRKLRAWEIVLIVLGSPIWLSLLIAAVCVVISIYAVLWSLIISLWAVELAVALSFIYCIISGVVCFALGHTFTGLAVLGTGLFCAGIAIFLFFGCKAATKGIIALTKKIAKGIKSLFKRRRDNDE